jgi:hypothetical protein
MGKLGWPRAQQNKRSQSWLRQYPTRRLEAASQSSDLVCTNTRLGPRWQRDRDKPARQLAPSSTSPSGLKLTTEVEHKSALGQKQKYSIHFILAALPCFPLWLRTPMQRLLLCPRGALCSFELLVA